MSNSKVTSYSKCRSDKACLCENIVPAVLSHLETLSERGMPPSHLPSNFPIPPPSVSCFLVVWGGSE